MGMTTAGLLIFKLGKSILLQCIYAYFLSLFKYNLEDISPFCGGTAVSDPGFPRGGGTNPPGAPTYYFAKFSQKLHEIERIWTQEGGAASKIYCLVPSLHWEPYFRLVVTSPWVSKLAFKFHHLHEMDSSDPPLVRHLAGC